MPSMNVRKTVCRFAALALGAALAYGPTAGAQVPAGLAPGGLHIDSPPYRGEGEAIKDLVAGETQMETGVASAFLPFIRGGQLRALCVNEPKRLPLLPDVPTAAEAGPPDFDLPNWYALYAPRGAPEEVTQRLYQSVVKVLAIPEVRGRLIDLGLDSVGSSPREMAAYLERQFEFWEPVVEAAGARLTR
jgi:tripartite-type tricarboxylate transporter receptor subunit TctC